MNKGIATETILMLLVGIVVVGILVFLVYKYVIGAPLSQEECRARMIAWCTSCSLACKTNADEWSGSTSGSTYCGTYPGNGVGTSSGCANTYFEIDDIDNTNKCKDHKKDCDSFIPTT
jgi:hypothetical protein